MIASNQEARNASLWVLLFSMTATLTKVVGERFFLKRKLKLKWQDAALAAAGAALGYASYRMSLGERLKRLLA